MKDDDDDEEEATIYMHVCMCVIMKASDCQCLCHLSMICHPDHLEGDLCLSNVFLLAKFLCLI